MHASNARIGVEVVGVVVQAMEGELKVTAALDVCRGLRSVECNKSINE